MLIIQSKMVNLFQNYIQFDQKWSKTTGLLLNFDIYDQIQFIFDKFDFF